MKKYIILLAAVAVVIATAVIWENGKTSQMQFVLDTVSSITVKGNHKAAVNKAFDRVREIEGRMSSHLETSDIAEGNLHNDTSYVISKGISYGDISGGIFDITIKPISQLWNINGENPNVPSNVEISEALSLVDYKKIKLADGRLVLPEGMKIELGGIAKGYAADEACRVLKENGVEDGLVDLGGNIVAIGTKTIGIRNPVAENNGDYFGTLKLTDCAIATSGGYERYFEQDGVRYHHIFDTKTGYPVQTDILSATVISEKAIDADCWATILFSAGMDEAMEYIDKYGLKAVLVDNNKNVHIFGDIYFAAEDDFEINIVKY